MTAGWFAVRAPSAATAIALVSVVTFAYSCWAANVLTLPADVFPGSVVASAVGLNGSAAGIGGMLSTLSVGWVVQHYSYTPVFTTAAFAPLLAATAILCLVRPRRLARQAH
jgi:MFS transporter, ACS family, hexuronate transporter